MFCTLIGKNNSVSLIAIYVYFCYGLNAKCKCATVSIITSLCRMFTVVWSLTDRIDWFLFTNVVSSLAVRFSFSKGILQYEHFFK